MKDKIRVGIIAEYNPFHNGHIYQFNQIKNKWPNATIVVILSGKYVQRGEIAIASFEDRKQAALFHGADEVYELDFYSSTQAAHIFASGAITLATKHNIDVLAFGSETNNIDDFILVAQKIYEDEPRYYSLIKQELKKGISFPKANQIVLENLIGKSFVMPNDILGLEYVKFIIKNKLNIQPYCFQRSIGFHSLEPNDNIASATYIRKLIYENNQEYKKYTPMIINQPIDKIENHYNEFVDIVKKYSVDELRNIHLVSEGMENLFKKNIDAPTYEEFVSRTNSKRYTSSRIKRTMLYVLLGIKKSNL